MGQSWSSIRKRLEQEFLCESLKGRIQFFATRYPKLSDVHTRVALRLDGQEILKSDFIQWRRACAGLSNAPGNDIEIHNRGGFDSVEFYRAFHTYQNQSIELSMTHEDPLVRFFAILDKRVGKRKLRALTATIPLQPEWLKPIYWIRMESEGIIKNCEGSSC